MPLMLVVAAWLTVLPASGRAQEPGDSIRIELARLRARIDSLESVIRTLQATGQEEEAQDALAELRAAAAAAAAEGGAPPPAATQEDAQFEGRQRSLQALNPEISVSVDMLGHLDTDDTNADNFVPREFEFSFQSTLDPFSRAKVFLTNHNGGPELSPFAGDAHGDEHEEGSSVEVEEGYVEWVSLPGGISLKLGKFFQRFGAMNRWHSHALPFQSRSLPHLAYLGEEPLAQSGLSATWLAPFGSGAAYEATVEVTRSSNDALFGESTQPNVLTHVNAFWETSEATDLDLGLSWVRGIFEDADASLDRNLFGAELAFTWRPPARAATRELQLRGGVMVLDGLEAPEGTEEGGDGNGQALGLWTMANMKLGTQWWAGLRFDRAENPADPEETAWLVSPTLTWWQSEWVRLRLEYDLLGRSFEEDREGRLWLWATFAMGPHKHETY